MEKQIDRQLVICPQCNGSGRKKIGLSCNGCNGLGLGIFFNNKFLYWGAEINKPAIRLRHLKKSFHLFLNLTAFTVGLIGLLSLEFWIWQNSNVVQAEAFLFWRVQHGLILLFWIGILADMFIIYRLSEEKHQRHKLKKFKFNKKIKRSPDNWSELKRFKDRIDVSEGFSSQAVNIIENAFLFAYKAGHKEVLAQHIFYSLLKNNEVISLFVRLNVDRGALMEKIKNQLLKNESKDDNKGKLDLSIEAKEVLIKAYISAYNLEQERVMALNLILHILEKDKNIEEILYDLKVDYDKINNVIEWFKSNKILIANQRLYRKTARYKSSTNMNKAYTAVATPVLNHFGYDLTIAAKWGRLEICVAMDEEVEKIFNNMASGQAGIILVGPEGVGKRTIVNGIAILMVKEEVPEFLQDKRLVELNVSRLVSGATPAQAEERLLVIIDEINKAGNIILFIEDIENLIGITSGQEESLELSEVLSDALNRKHLYCLATVSSQNYVKYIENKALGSAMVKVNIEEPSTNKAIQIAESKVSLLESKYGVYFSYDAIEQAVELSSKYIHDKYLPNKAIKILESVAVKIAKRCQKDDSKCFCSQNDIAEAISEETHIPVQAVTEEESEKLLNLEERVHQYMINQDEAVDAVANSIRRARTQLVQSKRPITNLLFLGPTGVGKTELAKTVARVYFGNKNYMIRLDMSEYQHPDSVKKMIGDAGQNTLGYLTESVRKQPFSLVLLDEFEKADKNILNLFLQVMDDGRLTDGQGRTIDFTNCIIIATSNIGSVYIQKEVSANKDISDIKQVLINEYLNKFIRPELINRFDGVIVFKPLSISNVIKIAELMLGQVGEMLKEKGISLAVEDEGLNKLAQEGYDPKFGARPLRRLIQEKIENKIAKMILEGKIDRRDTIVIDKQAEIKIEKGREL